MVELINYTQEYDKVLCKAISECHQKEATERVLKHCIEAGHLSVLEHAYATFEITCSIQTLLQLSRHRHFSMTVQSSRATVLQESLKVDNPKLQELLNEQVHNYVNCNIGEDINNEDRALLAPKAMMYKLVITGNLRAWYEYLPKRLCNRTQKEHRELAKGIKEELAKVFPLVFDRDLLNCKACTERSCSFD
ncbi:FAD-dependent thymidylate synthase [Veillonella intestinalis]|uniref:FAD-dependent thymidylate synthase n=1 Tax=Veillonella intestinalis TaxID=2941341 RepID=UPI00203AB393|nr:FAD-dependent thymidylate synthase [Veillonella intestinalis]